MSCPHNFDCHLGSLISAHMCAVAPNFKVMEIDIDDVTWKDDIITVLPVIEDGHLLLPTGPGWAPKSTKNSSAPTHRGGNLVGRN
jgi:galactonate dehydratase